MATQAALIADTIIGMKRALRREHDGKSFYSPQNRIALHCSLLMSSFSRLDSGPDDPITQPTNRGNKMHANAKFVSEGAMGYINAEEFYKEVRGSTLAGEKTSSRAVLKETCKREGRH